MCVKQGGHELGPTMGTLALKFIGNRHCYLVSLHGSCKPTSVLFNYIGFFLHGYPKFLTQPISNRLHINHINLEGLSACFRVSATLRNVRAIADAVKASGHNSGFVCGVVVVIGDVVVIIFVVPVVVTMSMAIRIPDILKYYCALGSSKCPW